MDQGFRSPRDLRSHRADGSGGNAKSEPARTIKVRGHETLVIVFVATPLSSAQTMPAPAVGLVVVKTLPKMSDATHRVVDGHEIPYIA